MVVCAAHSYVQVFNGLDPFRDCRNAKLRRQECPEQENGLLTFDSSEGLRYDLDLRAGKYSIWLRAWIPARFGPYQGGPASDSAWVGLGEEHLAVGEGTTPGAWTWIEAPARISVLRGTTPLVLRARERGFAVDRIIVTSDAALVPSGEGPAPTR